jgi:hypothetical protein
VVDDEHARLELDPDGGLESRLNSLMVHLPINNQIDLNLKHLTHRIERGMKRASSDAPELADGARLDVAGWVGLGLGDLLVDDRIDGSEEQQQERTGAARGRTAGLE